MEFRVLLVSEKEDENFFFDEAGSTAESVWNNQSLVGKKPKLNQRFCKYL